MKENKIDFYPIEGYDDYLLGKEGDNEWSVWRIKKNGELKKMEGSIDRSGHIRYTLHTDDGKQVVKRLHQLIAEMFIPIPQELLDSGERLHVHHINENKLDNRIENLIWMTASEHHRLHNKGEKHPFYGKHRPQGAGRKPKQVYQYDMENNLIAVWPSTRECGRNGYNQGNVSSCCNGKYKQYKGFKWGYNAPL